MKKNTTTLNWIEYYFGHCWMTGWQSIRGSFRIWSDLMTGNYKDYALMWYDDPYEECVDWFWQSLGDDDTLPKEFLEHLLEMCDRIDRGEEKLIPIEDVETLFEDLHNDEDTTEQA